jgi:hypothetical protein
MSEDEEQDIVVVTIKYKGKIRYFQSERDLWVLDANKWRDEAIQAGYQVPPFNEKYRYGIISVNENTVDKFLSEISQFEIDKDDLSYQLAIRFQTAHSWWDVEDLFPVLFVNFDDKKVAGFYPPGYVRLERYIADGWQGELIDFAREYPEEVFPKSEKFWVKGDVDLLAILCDKGINSKN